MYKTKILIKQLNEYFSFMPSIIEQKKFVLTSATDNNNKFWEYIIYDDNSLEIKWGRVGTTGQSKKTASYSRSRDVDSKVREKTGKGYREIKIVTEVIAPTKQDSASQQVIHAAAVEQLTNNNAALSGLVAELVKANKHELYVASGGKMDVDLSTGIVSTPIGVVGKENIIEARSFLNNMIPFIKATDFDNKHYTDALNDYLMRVPQKVGSTRGWHRSFIVDDNGIARQMSLLDQLDASVDLAESRLKQAALGGTTDNSIVTMPSLFNASISIVTDPVIIKHIEQLFFSTLNTSHVSSRLRPVRVFEVKIDKMHDAFLNDGAKMSDVRELWHGTRKFNVLSILKNGLIIPPTHGGTYQIAGRMFGNGVYHASQSSKSLNYSFGYWDSGAKDTNCFMFLNDVAMGNYYVPRSYSETLPKSGYDSTWAIPGKSGIQNDEMIVYRTSQCNIKYLIEFDSRV